MTVDLPRLASWLRCPVCSADLEPVDRLTLGCTNGHRHDVNKRGYVSLLRGGTKHLGDTAEMLDARDLVLEGGAYSPIADAVARAVADALGRTVTDADGQSAGHAIDGSVADVIDGAGGRASDNADDGAVANATDGANGRASDDAVDEAAGRASDNADDEAAGQADGNVIDGAVADATVATVGAPRPASGTGHRVLDAGAGTGYYLRAALAASPGAVGLAMDLSPQAVARAVRASDRVDGLVADTWRPLPVRSGLVDAVLDVFAPRNLPEFHRVLRPGGSLVVVVPRPDHLGSLRAAGTMLDIPSDKAEDVLTTAEPLYALQTRETVEYDLALTGALRTALAAMGPSARHAAAGAPAAVGSTRVAVDVLRLTRR